MQLRARVFTSSSAVRACGAAAGAWLALACSNDTSSGPRHIAPIESPPRVCQVPDPSCTPPPAVDPRSPPPGLSCPSIGCSSTPFVIGFETNQSWSEAAYFFRVSVDGGATSVCQIAFDARVAGAVVDTCNTPGDVGLNSFRVDYRYDATVRQIDAVTFAGQPRHVDLTLLVADDQPPLAEVHHDVQFGQTSIGEAPCVTSCSTAKPLVVQLAEPGDAGAPRDAGADAAPGDAATVAPLGDASAADARS